MKKRIDTLDGRGTITKEDGTNIGVCAYHLTIWQAQIADGMGGTIPGMLSIEGRIEVQGMEGYALVAAGETLTLELEDGRKLPFFVTNSNGQIAARGSLV